MSHAPAEARAGSAWSLAWDTLRVRQWWYFALLGAAPLAVGPAPGAGRLAMGVLAAGASLGFAYGINAIADRDGDHSPWKNPLIGAADVPAPVHALVWATAALALALSVGLGAWSVVAGGLSVAAGVVYSVGPRFKARPILGTICNATIFTPLLALGTGPGTDAGGLAALSLAFVVLLTQNQLVHEVADAIEDAPAGVITTGGVLGPQGAFRAAAALGLVGSLVLVAGLGFGPVPLVGSLGMVAGSAVALGSDPAQAADARRRHRLVAAIAGATLFGVMAAG